MNMWNTLGRGRRLVLVAGMVTIFLGFAGAAWWLLRTEHAVLFSELRPQDAAVMTAELDKLKVPYTLADNGATLLVDRAQVHAVRLKLMGRDLPLHGTVGLELFNHTDFGMTEFAQKINYQRALQGELTRTILSFSEIREARVHLALPDQGLFKQNTARPKAAITLGVRQGHALSQQQVIGIQRLVAAAVPGLVPQEVTVVDQHGLALNRVGEAESEGSAGSARLDLKRETENYLSRKAALVLEKAFGPGQALASVDVTLNMDQVRVTTEDVIAAPDPKGGPATGVLVRERESARDSATPDARTNDGRAARGSSMQRDVEYQAGRRVEQVVSQPGAIRRLHVVAVVRQDLQEDQKAQMHRLLAAAVGATPERGDTVVVQTLQLPPSAGAQLATPAAVLPDPAAQAPAPAMGDWIPVALAVLVLAGLALALQRRHASLRPPAVLTDSQRQAVLHRVQGWLLQSPHGVTVDAREVPTGRTE
jgi:flagellar M-ring protein FliF